MAGGGAVAFCGGEGGGVVASEGVQFLYAAPGREALVKSWIGSGHLDGSCKSVK